MNNSEAEIQQIEDKTKFYNSYYVINITDNKIEAIYESEINANFILRNFSEYFPSKNFIIAKVGKQIEERPTNKQLFRILQIENGYKIPYTGLTKESASRFLDRHINKTKVFDEEYKKLKYGS